MTSIHYRPLPRDFQSINDFQSIDDAFPTVDASTLRRRATEDVRMLKRSIENRQQIPAFVPRNYRNVRLMAYAGWALAATLLFTFLATNVNLVGVRQLARIPGLAFGSYHEEVAPLLPKGGVQSRVTIVSGFYKIESGKKHSISEYDKWLRNFLTSVELPIIFYCAPAQRAFISELRGPKPITIISNYETPFEMPPLVELGGRDWALAQHAIDPEFKVHVPDVYGVWTAKPWIVQQASEMDPYLSEFFFWVDAGAFRDSSVTHTFLGLPAALDEIYDKVPEDTLILASTETPFEKGTDFVKSARVGGAMDTLDRLQGGWYGGRKVAVNWWLEETRKVTTLQAGLQRFAAKEQPVWTQAARLNWRKIYVQNMAHRQGDCGADKWFGFEYFADGRDCVVPAWSGPGYARIEARGGDQWSESEGFKGAPSTRKR
ncbi:hypothetical protein P7C70_g310, partial [Phenoliferia sp. Uapishka_3]